MNSSSYLCKSHLQGQLIYNTVGESQINRNNIKEDHGWPSSVVRITSHSCRLLSACWDAKKITNSCSYLFKSHLHWQLTYNPVEESQMNKNNIQEDHGSPLSVDRIALENCLLLSA